MTDTAASEYYETVELHDREFQKYSLDRQIYCVPVDEEEEDRLILQHQIVQQLFDDRLFFPPLNYPRRILDCGYGRGSWALAMAQTYYESEVTAIDIFPAELPDEQPENLDFEVWNLNESLTPTCRANHYDLIHSRFVAPGIKRDRWRSYVRDLARLLRRGGWVQLVELYYIFQSDSGLLTDNHALQQWGTAYRSAMERDRDPRVGRHLKDLLRNAGLADVQERSFRMPVGSWPTDARQRQIGIQNLGNIDDFLDSHAVWPFTQRLGWTSEQVLLLTDRARQEARDPRLKLYIPLTAAWGKKR